MYKFTRISRESFELSSSKRILVCQYSEKEKTVHINTYGSATSFRTVSPDMTYYMDAEDPFAAVQMAASALENIE